jgi:phospholipase/carboxylesterase
MLDVRYLGVEKPELLVVLCHGYGAGGDDLVPLAPELVRAQPALEERVGFAFPAAPLSMAMGFGDARAWWPIDFPKLESSVRSKDFAAIFDDVPAGMVEARDELTATLKALGEQLGVPMKRTVLGGFSQGSMITTDITLRADDAPAGLLIWSGLLLNRPEWQRESQKRKGLTVLQAHGTRDPLLPYDAALDLKKLFEDAGADHTFVSHGGGHEIPRPALDASAQWLANILARVNA